MSFRTRSKLAANVAAPTADPVVMGRPDLGYNPCDLRGTFQVYVKGLDGGTWDAKFHPAGGNGTTDIQDHELGNAETDTVIFDGTAVEAFRVEFAGLGGAAAPEVFVTPQSR